MRFKKFLKEVYLLLLNDVCIDYYTLKNIIDLFKSNLSVSEFEKYELLINILYDKTKIQLTIDDITDKLSVKELENELELLKGKIFE